MLIHPTQEIIDLLNNQISRENQASFNYLQMATWLETNALPGATKFFYEQAEEERMHMLKLIRYVAALGKQPHIAPHTNLEGDYSSLHAVAKKFLLLEKQNSKAIHVLVSRTFAVQDLATYQFLQWFVEEQREEEATAQKMCDLFTIIPEEGIGLYTIDKEIGKLTEK